MVTPCFEGAESISDLGLSQFQPFRGFLGFGVFLGLLSFFLAIPFLVNQKKNLSYEGRLRLKVYTPADGTP